MTGHNTKFCEIKLLKNEEDTTGCNIRITNITGEVWIKLRQSNTWIYTLPQEESVHVSCGPEVFDQKVKGTGILAISPECEINTNHILIKGFRVSDSIIYRNIIPSVKLNIDMNETVRGFLETDKFKLTEIVHPSIINFGQTNKLQDISMGLNEIRELQDELKNSYTPPTIKQHLNLFTITTIIFTLIVTGWTIKIIVAHIRKWRNKVSLEKFKKQYNKDWKRNNEGHGIELSAEMEV